MIIARILNIALILVSLCMGILILSRFAGKLKAAFIFLMMALIALLIRGVLRLIIAMKIADLEWFTVIMSILIALFILFTLLNLKSMINAIDNSMTKEKRSKKGKINPRNGIYKHI